MRTEGVAETAPNRARRLRCSTETIVVQAFDESGSLNQYLFCHGTEETQCITKTTVPGTSLFRQSSSSFLPRIWGTFEEQACHQLSAETWQWRYRAASTKTHPSCIVSITQPAEISIHWQTCGTLKRLLYRPCDRQHCTLGIAFQPVDSPVIPKAGA